MVTFERIEAARRRIQDAIYVSPCARSETFSRLCDCQTYFKLENLQMTGSFKERGALNKLLTLSAEERARGVIAASAGNHAQGLAYHAARLGVRATIVMPEPTALIKVSTTRSFGAGIVLRGSSYDDAYEEAVRIAEAEGLVFVHPFDDDDVIAGQGTIGLELLEQNPYVQAVIVPIGGGGLISGIGVALKETNPKITLIGVQAELIPSMLRSVEAGRPHVLPGARTIADGIAVRRVGERTLPLVQRYVDQIVTVTEEEIANAILLLLEREKTVAEGAAGATLAALVNRKVDIQGKRVVMVLSGGNIDVNLIARVIERGLVKDHRLVRLKVTVSDVPGSLAKLTRIVADKRANVIEIHHERAFAGAGVGETLVELTIETRGRDHIDELLDALRAEQCAVREER